MHKAVLTSTLVLLPLLVVAAAVAQPPAKIPGASGTVFAVERFDFGQNTLAAFDASTGDVLNVAPIGKRPIGVTVPHGTGKVYTTDERSNQLSVLDEDTLEPLAVIPTGAASFPHHMMASPNGRFLYFGRYNTNTVGVVDTSRDEMVHVWPASYNESAKTHAVWVTNDGKNLYATNEGATQLAKGTLSKLDAQTGGLVWEYEIGARPSEVLVTPDRKTAYVSVRNDHKVRVLDISGDAPHLIGETAIGVQPDTLQITNDGKTLVVGLRSIPQMALMDTDSLAVRQVTFPGYGISGHEWLSANGKYTYIALESLDTTKPGAIGVVANASAEIVDIWTYPGGPWPHGVFYEPRVLEDGG